MDLIKYLENAAVEADTFWGLEDVQPQSGDAIVTKESPFLDNASLMQLLEMRPTMICMIVTPDGGDSEETEESPDPQVPSEDDGNEESFRDSEG